MTPIFIVLISIILFNNKLKKQHFAGILIGFIGCFILIAFEKSIFEISINHYAFYILLATLCYAISANLLKYKLNEIQPLYISSLALLSVGPIAGIVFMYNGGVDAIVSSNLGMSSALYTALLGVIASALALVMFNKLIQISPIIFASSVTYLIPIVAILWGLLDGEILNAKYSDKNK